jgi:MinD-like ATPase involved in chromosome partitioning or flagellar assembly
VTDVVTALTPSHDAAIAASLELARGSRVVRRCADVAELVSVANAGIGHCAVVSADLRGLDLSLVGQLRASGLTVVGVHEPGDEPSERRLRQLSISLSIPLDAGPDDVQRLIGDTAPRPAGPPAESLVAGRGVEARPDEGEWLTSVPDRGVDLPSGRESDGATAGASGPQEHRAEARGRVIAVWGPLGSPGRTTIAVNLAAELAGRGSRVLLVDADTYGGCVAQTLGLLDEAPGLAAAARAADHGTLDLAALARLAPEALPRLRVLTGIPRPDRWPEISAPALGRVLELGRSLAAAVVVDCGFCLEDDEELSYDTQAPRRNAATLTTLAAADDVLAIGAADAVSLQRFVRGLQQLGTVSSPAPVPVVNRVRASSVGVRPDERVREVLARFAGLATLRLVPEDREAVDAALLAGRSVVEHAPHSPFAQAVADLASVLLPRSDGRSVSRAGRRRSPRARHAVRA